VNPNKTFKKSKNKTKIISITIKHGYIRWNLKKGSLQPELHNIFH